MAAVDRFGRIDVLINNAASFYAGYFEELRPEQFLLFQRTRDQRLNHSKPPLGTRP